MSDLKVSEAHLQELRKVHSMLHASMDALIRDMNANEAARLLILLDDRLTTLINAAAAEREPKPDRKRPDRPFTGVGPTFGEALPTEAPDEQRSTKAAEPVATPVAGESLSGKDVSGKPQASVSGLPAGAAPGSTGSAGIMKPEPVRATPAASTAGAPATAKPSVAEPLTPKPPAPTTAIPLPPPPADEPEPVLTAARPPESEALPDSGPILFVPPPLPPKPVRVADVSAAPAKAPGSEMAAHGPATPAAGKAETLPPAPPSMPKAAPAAALPDSPRPAPAGPVPASPDLSRPTPAIPPVAPFAERPKTAAEPEDASDEPEWVEEDFEDGEDLEERAGAGKTDDPFDDEIAEVAAAPADEAPASPASGGGLFGSGLFSKLKLPGFGRRKVEEKAPQRAATDDETDDLQDDIEDGFDDDLDDDLIEDEDEPTPSAADHELDVRRLHAVVDQLAADNLLDEALRRTGNRIELRKVEEGLDIVVKGLPAALGTVRLDETDGHVLYQPRFGLDLPEREPNRADLELWLKAMGDVVVHVLADIAQRRSKSGATDSEPTA